MQFALCCFVFNCFKHLMKIRKTYDEVRGRGGTFCIVVEESSSLPLSFTLGAGGVYASADLDLRVLISAFKSSSVCSHFVRSSLSSRRTLYY